MDSRKRFAYALVVIRNSDPSYPDSPPEMRNYTDRNAAIYAALCHALQLGYRAGIAIDPNEPDWPVAYIDLPTGQVSWHLAAYPGTWDRHTTEEKYGRIDVFVAGVIGQ